MRIFNFILIICLFPLISIGQSEIEKRPRRADNFVRMRGLRVGMDITRPSQHLWTKGDRYGTELSFDIEIKPNLFSVLETGWEKMKIKNDYVRYNSSGSYTRIGVDYNFLEAEHKNDMDILYIGVRYGISFARQEVPYFNLNDYWAEGSGHFPQRNYNAQWVEGILGLKAEIFNNFFLGWTIRGKLKTHQTDVSMPTVYFNPGYGKAENKFNFDFTYSIFYNLPFKFR